MGLFDWFRKLEPVVLVAHDPKDRTCSDSASKWVSENYCDRCLAAVEHEEIMTDICLSCGKSSKNWPFGFNNNRRAVRKLYNGTRWVYQYSYRNDDDDKINLSDVRL